VASVGWSSEDRAWTALSRLSAAVSTQIGLEVIGLSTDVEIGLQDFLERLALRRFPVLLGTDRMLVEERDQSGDLLLDSGEDLAEGRIFNARQDRLHVPARKKAVIRHAASLWHLTEVVDGH
jgi:hypothetical protein